MRLSVIHTGCPASAWPRMASALVDVNRLPLRRTGVPGIPPPKSTVMPCTPPLIDEVVTEIAVFTALMPSMAFWPMLLEDTAVADLHDVAGPNRQRLGRWGRWRRGRQGRWRRCHGERAVEHVTERRRRIAGLAGRDPGQIVGHGAMERDRVHAIEGTPVAADVGERSEEAVEVDRGEGGRGVRDGIVRQRQPAGGDGIDAGRGARVFAGVLEVDSEGAGVVDARLVDKHRLAGEPDGEDALQSAAAD